jgi:superfamily I DNA/RNA helicase
MLSDVIGADAAAIADWRGLVGHTGSPLILRGPAGSGKTEFLIARFRWFVEHGVIPDRIVWLAPSEARADAAWPP